MRFGITHNLGENALAHQPSTFCTVDRQLDGVAALSTILSGTSLLFSKNARVLVASLSKNAAQIASAKSPRAPRLCADSLYRRWELALRAGLPPAR